MESEANRARLATAMGWKVESRLMGVRCIRAGESVPRSFNPFIYAEDDYAVLEWMRLNGAENMPDDFPHRRQASYQIGDYARAWLNADIE